MNHTNAWSDPSQADPEDISRMAEHLEERSKRSDQLQVNWAVCEALDPQPGERLLEVGCGTGTLCRLVASHLTLGGKVIGLDISSRFIDIARQRSPWEVHSGLIHYKTAQAEAIPYTDDCLDGAWAVRLLLHATDPNAVVSEMARVVRPGGRIVLADWDFETATVDHPNRELTRRLLHWRNDHKGGDNWSGRQLLARASDAGLRKISVTPLVVVARDEEPALTQSLWRAAEVARDGGAITPDEHDIWISTLKERIAGGRFFASIVYFIVKGWK